MVDLFGAATVAGTFWRLPFSVLFSAASGAVLLNAVRLGRIPVGAEAFALVAFVLDTLVKARDKFDAVVFTTGVRLDGVAFGRVVFRAPGTGNRKATVVVRVVVVVVVEVAVVVVVVAVVDLVVVVILVVVVLLAVVVVLVAVVVDVIVVGAGVGATAGNGAGGRGTGVGARAGAG